VTLLVLQLLTKGSPDPWTFCVWWTTIKSDWGFVSERKLLLAKSAPPPPAKISTLLLLSPGAAKAGAAIATNTAAITNATVMTLSMRLISTTLPVVGWGKKA
jgi:hypothetical protein